MYDETEGSCIRYASVFWNKTILRHSLKRPCFYWLELCLCRGIMPAYTAIHVAITVMELRVLSLRRVCMSQLPSSTTFEWAGVFVD
jgi:hypothetical protein